MDSGKEIVLEHQLWLLTLGPTLVLQNFLRECNVKDTVLLEAFLSAARRSQVSVNRLIGALRIVLFERCNDNYDNHNDSHNHNNNHHDGDSLQTNLESFFMNGGNDSRDILLQVTVAALAYEKSGKVEMIGIIIDRLGKLEKDITEQLTKCLKKTIGPQSTFYFQIKQLPFNAGMAILVGCIKEDVAESSLLLLIESACKWLGENGASFQTDSLALKCLGMYLKRQPIGELKKNLIPVLSRLLLRSSTVALTILLSISSSLPVELLLEGDFGDSLWIKQLCSENDDNRNNVQKILIMASQGNPTAIISKINQTWAGKSFKAKKAIATTLFKVIPRAVNEELNLFLSNLTLTETNEEVLYHLLSSWEKTIPTIDTLLKEGLDKSKPSVRTTYLAALSSGLKVLNPALVESLQSLLQRKDTSVIDQLLVVNILAGNCPIEVNIIKAGLSVTGFLGEKNLLECKSRFPFLALSNLVKLLGGVTEVELAKGLWKVIAFLHFKVPSLRQNIMEYLKASKQLSTKALAKAIIDNRDSEYDQTLGRMAIVSVKSEVDLAELFVAVNTGSISHLELWNSLVITARRLSMVPAPGEFILERLIPVTDEKAISKAITTFPQVVPFFAEFCQKSLLEIANIKPSEEDICILKSPDEKLPIIDGTLSNQS